ncbi:hypothetical protein ABMA09_22825 [Erwinia rhapontici]
MSQLISGYEQEFHDAIERTDSWGLCAPYFKASDKRYIDENSLQKLTEYLDVFFSKDRYETTISTMFSGQLFNAETNRETVRDTTHLYAGIY